MVIHNFNVIGFTVTPDKTNPPLIVNPDTMLSVPISLERLETVAWRNPKILQLLGGMKIEELATGHSLDGPKSSYWPIFEESLGFRASERSDQDPVYDGSGIPSSGMQIVGATRR